MSTSHATGTAEDEPVSGCTTPTREALSPADVLARAAEVIERNGLAHGTYRRQQPGAKAQNAPVCTLGAIAIAVGAEPYAWEEAYLWRRELATATVAIEALLDFLGLSSETPDEALSRWNDSHDVAAVIGTLRATAREVDLKHSGRTTGARQLI
ncbi:DUF6197 family protein [Nonomuraea sp. NPDC004297]